MVGRILTRREVITLFGAAGASFLIVGCSPSAATPNAESATAVAVGQQGSWEDWFNFGPSIENRISAVHLIHVFDGTTPKALALVNALVGSSPSRPAAASSTQGTSSGTVTVHTGQVVAVGGVAAVNPASGASLDDLLRTFYRGVRIANSVAREPGSLSTVRFYEIR